MTEESIEELKKQNSMLKEILDENNKTITNIQDYCKSILVTNHLKTESLKIDLSELKAKEIMAKKILTIINTGE